MRRRTYLERNQQRLFYSLAELERLTGLNRNRIYALEKMGFIRAKMQNGRRLYGSEALKRLQDFRVLSEEYPTEVIVRSYEELKLTARLIRCKNGLLRIKNRIRRFLKRMGEEDA